MIQFRLVYFPCNFRLVHANLRRCSIGTQTPICLSNLSIDFHFVFCCQVCFKSLCLVLNQVPTHAPKLSRQCSRPCTKTKTQTYVSRDQSNSGYQVFNLHMRDKRKSRKITFDPCLVLVKFLLPPTHPGWSSQDNYTLSEVGLF
jgi:hypothetical protein